MEYLLDIDKINTHHLIFKLPIKNQNVKYNYYYKLLYSDMNIHLKYVLIKAQFQESYVDSRDNYYKIKVSKKDPFFQKVKKLEHVILTSINQSVGKKIVYGCYQDLITKDILYHSPHSGVHQQDMYLKISGIWEDDEHIGLVYKVYYMMSTEKWSNMIC